MTAAVPGRLGPVTAVSGPRLADRTAVASVPRRRRLQIALALIWLVDAALQYQPYMFGRAFVTQTIEPAAQGTPFVVSHPSAWAAHLLLPHITAYNAAFATIQLLIALAILRPPTARLGLAASLPWSLAVWWLAEGIGGITLGATPVMGAPGAVLLYAFIALLVWPRRRRSRPDNLAARSVATSGALGARLPRLLWAALWLGFAALQLETVNRAPSALAAMVDGMSDGEPGWIQAMNRILATPLAHHGTEWSITLAGLSVLVALGIFIAPLLRPVLVVAIILAVAFWLAQDFGAILTGTGTDVNTGPLLVLLAATFWPYPPPGRHAVGR